jgi:hypothetical protein
MAKTITGSAFKLSKESKRMLAQESDPVRRGVLKRLMIDAEVANAVRPKIRERSEGAPRAGSATASTDASE